MGRYKISANSFASHVYSWFRRGYKSLFHSSYFNYCRAHWDKNMGDRVSRNGTAGKCGDLLIYYNNGYC